ncbi:MAG: DMT family transporter [Nitrospinae bacterium]|nr:DMT family transporter [Nitrospinota bacterium]
MNLSTHVVGLLFAASALLSWTSLSFFVRLAMKGAPLLRTTAAMSTINGAFVSVLVYFTLPVSAFQPGSTRTWVLLPITAFFMITISRLTYYYAIRRIGPSRTIPIAASTPAVTAILATIFLGEPFTILIILGLLCLIVGLNLVVRSAPAQPNLEMGHTRKDVVKGYISAGLTTLNWSVSGVMVRTITLDMNALAASALLIWIGLGFAWVLAVGFAHRESADKIPKASWKWMLSAAVCQTIAVPSFSNAMARTYAVGVTSITSVQPLLVILGSHLFLRESENITGKLVLGAVMTVLGTILILIRL